MTHSIQFPSMRSDVIDPLRARTDRDCQRREWGRFDERRGRYDDLTLNVNLLYDDCRVLPEPSEAVGVVLYPQDVAPLQRLGEILGPMIDDLEESPDSVYLADERWARVVDAARQALAVMSGPEDD